MSYAVVEMVAHLNGSRPVKVFVLVGRVVVVLLPSPRPLHLHALLRLVRRTEGTVFVQKTTSLLQLNGIFSLNEFQKLNQSVSISSNHNRQKIFSIVYTHFTLQSRIKVLVGLRHFFHAKFQRKIKFTSFISFRWKSEWNAHFIEGLKTLPRSKLYLHFTYTRFFVIVKTCSGNVKVF